MKKLHSVRILHPLKNRVAYNYIAEFFRFVGIFVSEDIIGHSWRESESSVDQDDQLSLYLSAEKTRDEKEKNSFWVNTDKFKKITFGSCTSKTKGNLGYYIRKWQHVIKDITEFSCQMGFGISKDIYREILPIFVKNNTVKAAVNLQYYRMNSHIHQECQLIFRNTLDDLLQIRKCEIQDKFAYQYAVLYCKQKINLACWFQEDKPLEFSVGSLVQECKRLIYLYPDEANLYVLLGMIAERSHGGYGIALSAYKTALSMIGDQPYASHIYYWIGLLNERNNGNVADAKRAYAKAYALQGKYRNIYKVAVMFEREHDFVHMKEYLEKCLDSLEIYLDKKMDPLEMEYYYKVCALLCLRTQKYFEDNDTAIKYGLKALKFYDDYIDDIGSFLYFYGIHDYNQFQQVSKKRICRKKIYEALAIAYRNIGDLEKSEYYRNKF